MMQVATNEPATDPSPVSLGTLYVVSAPSGAGKSSLMKALTQADHRIAVSVSHTTRRPRPGEADGTDYHFVSSEQFERLLAADEFLEYAMVFDNYYGTSATSVKTRLQQGYDVILEIDWQGARQVRMKFPDSVSIFILPPSAATLETRLRNRGLDDDDIIAKRLAGATEEMRHSGEFDYVILNDVFQAALGDLLAILRCGRLTVQRQSTAQAALLIELLVKRRPRRLDLYGCW